MDQEKKSPHSWLLRATCGRRAVYVVRSSTMPVTVSTFYRLRPKRAISSRAKTANVFRRRVVRK